MIGNFIETKETTARIDSSRTMDVPATNVRHLFTYETGQVLETFGMIFVNIPPFNDHINQNTGRMLISIGKKLKRK